MVSNHVRDRDRDAFISNPIDGGTDRRVQDLVVADKVDNLASALGVTPTTTVIYNKAVPLANTEVSHILPAGVKKFSLRSRLRGTIKLAYTSGDSGILFFTIVPGTTYVDQNLYSSLTIYMQSNKAGDTIEIVAHA